MTIDTVLARVTTSPSAAPVEVVTPIKASEAIRLGILLAPVQAFGFWTGAEGSACALMALHLGGYDWSDNRPGGLSTRHCPVIDCPRRGVLKSTTNLLPHLNDDHRWTRERIADWLEGLGL